MGIRSLKKFISKECPETLKREHIKTLADLHVHRRINGVREKSKIVVDGSTCAFEIYGDTDMYCGGQFDAFKEDIKRFVEAFKNLDISLVFFFIGAIPIDEIEKWMNNQLKNEGLYEDFIENIECDLKEKKRFEWIKRIFYLSIKALYKDDEFVEIYTAPPSQRTNAIAQYAIDNNCVAILSDDSDFYIFDTKPIISHKNLKLNEMTTTVVNHTYICEQLDCTQTVWQCMGALKYADNYLCLTLFATDLEDRFQVPLSRRSRVEDNQSNPNFELLITYIKSINTTVNNDNQISIKIADELKKYGDEAAQYFTEGLAKFNLGQQETTIYRKVIDGAVEFTSHESVVQYFNTKVITADIFPTVVEAITYGKIILRTVPIGGNGEQAVVDHTELFKTVRLTLYGLIFNSTEIEKKSIYEIRFGFEPPLQRWPTNDINLWSLIYMQILRNNVEPISIMRCSDKESLTMLWKNKTLKLPENEIIQVNCLLKCFGIATDNSLQEIPTQFHPLAIILRYMFKYPNINLEDWEVEAFVVQALLFSSENKNWTKFPFLEFRPCHLAALFVQGILLYVDVSLCCCLDFEPAMPWNYFDGQRFQYCYYEIQKGTLTMQLFLELLPSSEVDYYCQLKQQIVSFIIY